MPKTDGSKDFRQLYDAIKMLARRPQLCQHSTCFDEFDDVDDGETLSWGEEDSHVAIDDEFSTAQEWETYYDAYDEAYDEEDYDSENG